MPTSGQGSTGLAQTSASRSSTIATASTTTRNAGVSEARRSGEHACGSLWVGCLLLIDLAGDGIRTSLLATLASIAFLFALGEVLYLYQFLQFTIPAVHFHDSQWTTTGGFGLLSMSTWIEVPYHVLAMSKSRLQVNEEVVAICVLLPLLAGCRYRRSWELSVAASVGVKNAVYPVHLNGKSNRG